MSGFLDDYTPHPGPMQIAENGYQPHDDIGTHNVRRSNHPTTIDEIQMAAFELGGAKAAEPEVKYEDSLMEEDFFDLQVKLLNDQFDEPPLIPRDTNEVAHHIMEAHSKDNSFEFDNDLGANMFEIQMAVEQTRADINPEPRNIGLAIPQDFFEQQEQMYENQFYEMQQFAELDYGAQMEADFNAQEAMLEQPVEEMGPLADLGPQTLENIIEAEQMQYEDGMPDDMAGMQALMDEGPDEQMYETPEQMEPYPTPIGYDDGMMPQEMYDEQMQDMMDPYMMPGLFGPGPMLDPGPGGPP